MIRGATGDWQDEMEGFSVHCAYRGRLGDGAGIRLAADIRTLGEH